MAILAVSQFTAQHATKFHSYGYASARVSGSIFDIRNGPDIGDQVFELDFAGVLTLGAALPIASGGLGLTTLAQGDIVYASALDTVAGLTVGAADEILTSNGTIPGWTAGLTNTHIAVGAEILVSKLADGSARQLLQTDAGGTSVEWTTNVDIPGTLDVTGAAVFDTTTLTTGVATFANTVQLRNGVTAVGQEIYGTFTDGSNYERLSIGYQAGGGLFGENFYIIEPQIAGTGTSKGMQIGAIPGTGDDLYLTGYVYGEFSIAAEEGFNATRNFAGSHIAYTGTNSNTGATSDIRTFLQTAATGGGDPWHSIVRTLTTVYSWGIDGTTGDLRFYPDTAPSTRPRDSSNGWTMDSSGNVQFINNVGIGVASLAGSFLHLGAATTAKSSILLPHGTAPSSPANGDLWTTSAGGLFVRINGVTVGPLDASGGDITRINITAGAGLTGSVDTTSGDHTQTIDVIGTSNRITVNANNIDIHSSYVGQTSITTLGTITTGTIPAERVSPGSFISGTFTFDSTVNATTFVGALTGDVTGNADTAALLETPRTINGTTFDGGSNITITAAAFTLTGTELNNGVVTSSLTALGTITALRADDAGIGIAISSSTFINLAIATTGKSSLRIGHGVAPTSPVNGDIWTTSAEGFFVRINGTTVGPLGASGTGDITNVNITAGIGMDGSVNTAAGAHTQTLDFLPSGLTALASGLASGDELVVSDAGVAKRALISGINLGIFANDQNWSSTVGTVTSVTAGAGMTQTGTSTINPTLNVIGTSNRILVNASSIDIHGSYVGQTSITTLGTIGAGTWQGNVISTTYTAAKVTGVTGGTGINSTEGTAPDIEFDADELAIGGAIVGADYLVASNGSVSNRQLVSTTPLGEFSNNLGWTTNAGTVTTVTAGVGLSGGGSPSPTITLDLSELSLGGTPEAGDHVAYVDGGLTRKIAFSSIPLSIMSNSVSGFTTNVGDLTAVTVGLGLDVSSGTGPIPDITIDFNELPTHTSIVGTDQLVSLNGTVESRAQIDTINLSLFINNLGWTTNTGTVTSVATGTGLDGSFSTSGTITLNLTELAAITLGAGDHLVVVDGTNSRKALLSNTNLSLFSNNLGWTTNTGTVTSVATGSGLTGGTITGSGTLSVDSTVIRTTGAQTITGVKTFNDDVYLGFLDRLYLDGGTDTYIVNASGDRIEIVTGGSLRAAWTTTAVTFPQAFSLTTGNAENVNVDSGGILRRSTSALRYKHHVKDYPLSKALNLVSTLRPISYQHKMDEDKKDHLGFIAEEVALIEPMLVTYLELDGELLPDAIEYARITVALVSVVKDLMARVESL